MSSVQKTIIIVEDEWLIRIDAADELRNHGFEVLEAGDAKEGLELLQLHHLATAVLFTDVHMPGTMDGLGLAHYAHTHWPWIAILVASGQARLTKDDLPAGSRFLPKPYEATRLVAHVRELATGVESAQRTMIGPDPAEFSPFGLEATPLRFRA